MRALRIVLAFVVAAVAGYALSLAVYALCMQITGTIDREGAFAMGVAFMIGPAVALVFGIVAAVWMAMRR